MLALLEYKQLNGGTIMAINWTKLYKEHSGEWVALKDDEKTVITHGKNAKGVLQQATKKGFENPIMMEVPKKVLAYIG